MATRHALVTGAAQGIGLAVARTLLADGIETILVDRSAEVESVARAAESDLGTRALGLVCDVAEAEQVIVTAQAALSAVGVVDIVVNNAGVHPKHDGGPMEIQHSELDVWNQVLAVNLTAPFLFCRELLPAMKDSGWGRVINMSSRAGRTVSPLASTSYASTKAGVLGFSRKLAAEVASYGITVNCLAPGPIWTALSETASPERRAALTRTIPVGRYGTVDEIAAAVSFLASDSSSFTTGAILDVNGGSFMP